MREEQPEERQNDEHLSREAVDDERQTLQERLHHWVDFPLALLAIVWAALLVAELALSLPPAVSARIVEVNWAIWFIFAAVFFIEFVLAPRKGRYLRNNVLAALSIVLPFVRAIRILKFARLFRSLSLVRITLIANRATSAAAELFSRQGLHYAIALTVVATLLGAAGVFYFERGVAGTSFTSFGESLWWAAALTTTINLGYDPVTIEARLIAIAMRVFGVGVFGYVAGSIASYLVEQHTGGRRERASEQEALRQLTREVELLRLRLNEVSGASQEQDKEGDQERT